MRTTSGTQRVLALPGRTGTPPGSTRAADGGTAASRSLWRTVAAGTLGSAMLFLGSLGVGWLASISGLRRNPLVMWMRFETIGVVVSIVLLALGAMLLVRQWLRLGQKLHPWGPQSARWVLTAIAAWSGPMLVSIPLFSRDVYSYIGQGRVMASGLNPYESGVSSIDNFFQLGADQLWAESPPPYGPVFLWLEQLVVTLSGGNPDVAVLLFRAMCVLAVLACMWVVPRLARLHGVNPRRALWLTVANPLLLTNFVIAAHNDAIMLALALLGTYAAAVQRNWRGGLIGTTLVTLSVAIKPITLVFLPFIGLLWAGRNASWPRRFVVWALTLAHAVVLLGIMGLVSGFGFGWVSAVSTPGTVYIWYAPFGLLGLFAQLVGDSWGLDGSAWMDAVHSLGTLLAAGTAVVLMFVGRDGTIMRRLAWSMAGFVLLAPIIQAWYVVWLIPLFAITGIRPDWHTDVLFFITGFFTVYAVADQLDVFPYLDLNLIAARVISALVAFTFGVYLWALDPATRRIRRADPVPRAVVL
ncbi:polyprenol phosphomannose-dependent alpha 1,6 mannosyltransferase MptB [Kocuria rhizophila]|uniref:polyprenol phosphomannose-dependent alpha 1,6 mannosyltransferase MptB n=1 Tax=Kocuria rhizophila TaxID=72000 RepID=UPI00190CE5B8|nr:polyprenol phosphomannose-dependent alpha 1,6 mannosyltransferase MptB [Kocuria rhizophila]MBK4120717.1 polyprenol phosphomannose-dependent alpha 1,6 mannosyltransferase MptB [Kocuria rhizophila]